MTRPEIVREFVVLTAGFADPAAHSKLVATLASGNLSMAHKRARIAWDSIEPADRDAIGETAKRRCGEILVWLDEHKPD